MITTLTIAISGCLTLFVCHLFFQRFIWVGSREKISRQKALIKLIMANLLLFAGWGYWSSRLEEPYYIVLNISYIVLVISGISYSYFHFFNMSETARRIHILVLLFEKQCLKKQETFEELNEYDPEHIIRMRIERLLNMGLIVEIKNKYYCYSRIIVLCCKLIIFYRKIFFEKDEG